MKNLYIDDVFIGSEKAQELKGNHSRHTGVVTRTRCSERTREG